VDISDALPGADLIRKGLDDLARGIESVPALLVLIGVDEHRLRAFMKAIAAHAREAGRVI